MATGSAESESHPHDDQDLGEVTPGSTIDALQVAGGFAAAWVRRDLPADEWWEGVAAYCSPQYAELLRSTDPANVPASKITGPPELAEDRGPSRLYEIPTNAGTLQVLVTAFPEGWVVTESDFVREGVQ